MAEHLGFEKTIVELEDQIEALRKISSAGNEPLKEQLRTLEAEAMKLRREVFSRLTEYEITQMSRHPKRPYTLDMISAIMSDFIELHGDRNFLDDKAIVGGIGTIDGHSVMVIGHQKGRGTKDNILRNFGMPRPEGYRKALRLMSMAERLNLPILTFIDTPGAYPGVGAEERGQSEAIAKNIMVMSRLTVPIISIVIGEGGSGGALALGVANKVHMMTYSVYSVISPEGCASILLKDAGQAKAAAEALKISAGNALRFGIIDTIIEEPEGGAHRNMALTAERVKKTILKDLVELKAMTLDQVRDHRYKKFQDINFISEC